jgi:hypothetical protein
MQPTTRPISICTGNGIPKIEPLDRGNEFTGSGFDVIVLGLACLDIVGSAGFTKPIDPANGPDPGPEGNIRP